MQLLDEMNIIRIAITTIFKQKEKTECDLFFESMTQKVNSFLAYPAAKVKWVVGNIVTKVEINLQLLPETTPINTKCF